MCLFDDEADYAAHVGHEQSTSGMFEGRKNFFRGQEVRVVLVQEAASPARATSKAGAQIVAGRRSNHAMAEDGGPAPVGLDDRPAGAHQPGINAKDAHALRTSVLRRRL